MRKRTSKTSKSAPKMITAVNATTTTVTNKIEPEIADSPSSINETVNSANEVNEMNNSTHNEVNEMNNSTQPESTNTATETRAKTRANRVQQETKKIKLANLVNNAKAENDQLFGKLNSKKVAAIVQAVLKQVSNEITTTESGNVALKGLGKFMVKQTQKEKDGQTVTRRRVVFRAMRAKKKKA